MKIHLSGIVGGESLPEVVLKNSSVMLTYYHIRVDKTEQNKRYNNLAARRKEDEKQRSEM